MHTVSFVMVAYHNHVSSRIRDGYDKDERHAQVAYIHAHASDCHVCFTNITIYNLRIVP